MNFKLKLFTKNIAFINFDIPKLEQSWVFSTFSVNISTLTKARVEILPKKKSKSLENVDFPKIS